MQCREKTSISKQLLSAEYDGLIKADYGANMVLINICIYIFGTGPFSVNCQLKMHHIALNQSNMMHISMLPTLQRGLLCFSRSCSYEVSH